MHEIVKPEVIITKNRFFFLMFSTMQKYNGGVIVDGFPRSQTQVNLLKFLYEKMLDYQKRYRGTPLEQNFPRPRFRMCVFWIDENESVARQLKRHAF